MIHNSCSRRTAIALLMVIMCSGCYLQRNKFTRITRHYPGVEAGFKVYPNNPKLEHNYIIFIDPASLSTTEATVIFHAGDELSISGVDLGRIHEFATNHPDNQLREQKDDDGKTVRISFPFDKLQVLFDSEGRVKSVVVSGTGVAETETRVKLVTKRGTAIWPCSREELAAALGDPLSEESTVEDVTGP